MSSSLLLTKASLLIPGLPSRESRYYVSSRGPTRRFKHHLLPAHREKRGPGGRFLGLSWTVVSASIISRFGLRFVGSSVASSAASGDGPLGAGSAAGSAVPSMTSPARAASMV